MMLGDTGVTYAIRYLPVYMANLTLLGELVGATLLGWALPTIREVPPPPPSGTPARGSSDPGSG